MAKGNTKNKAWPQYLAAITASLGMMTAGTTVGWTSPSMTLLLSKESPVPMSYSDFAWITGTTTIGIALSPIAAACLIGRIGCKPILITTAVLYIASWSLIIPATSVTWLYMAKIFSGVAFGLSTCVTPIYLSEISEPQRRGAIGVLKAISVVIGIIFESVAVPRLAFKTVNGMSMIFPIIFLLTFVWMPETPYFYASRDMTDKAYVSLLWLRGQTDRKVLEDEMAVIKSFTKSNKTLNFGQTINAILSKQNRRGFILVLVTFFALSYSGVVALALYTERIFILINSPINPSDAVILLNCFTTLCLVIAMLLIDKVGRKLLFLLSTIGAAGCNTIIGTYMLLSQMDILSKEFSWIAMLGLFGLKLFITMGTNFIPMILASEIFPSETKVWSVCIVTIFSSLCQFGVVKLFQVLDQTVGSFVPFYIFAVSLLLSNIICVYIMPETKNKSFNEIQESLQGKRKSVLEVE